MFLRVWHAIREGYLRLTEPLAAWCVRVGISPNALTVAGTLCCAATGVLFGAGWIRAAGWTLGLTAFFDVIDGAVARRSGAASVFGAFFDSTLDRVADAFLFGGLAWFFAAPGPHRSLPMVGVALVALSAVQITSYTRAKADALGVDLKGVGALERPERITLLAAPQAFFGLMFAGWVLRGVVILLAATAVWTVIQRVRHVAQRA
ncbi:MAG: CDP-alcohol phosphatidyltransferase family protein [Gemmatimonadaceae bacterium]|nr:CDP-alcohol phosphatidyltransferase family protein [Gemmatimonadaceae bacterium]MCW5825512.1 CDP-alcohol phosphatidyltransferase family protein [Gemmatimonadaceae bacterium]